MDNELFLKMLNCCDVRIDDMIVYIDTILITDAVCELVETALNNRAFRIVKYNDVYYRQNGYFKNNRNGEVTYKFGEQEWYVVKPQVKVKYEYQ